MTDSQDEVQGHVRPHAKPMYKTGFRVRWNRRGELYDREDWNGLTGRVVRKLDNLAEVDEADVGYMYEVDLGQGRTVHAFEEELSQVS